MLSLLCASIAALFSASSSSGKPSCSRVVLNLYSHGIVFFGRRGIPLLDGGEVVEEPIELSSPDFQDLLGTQ